MANTGDKTDKKKVAKKLLNDMKHTCKLPQEEDILVKYIDSGYCVDIRRSIRRWLMVSESNPRSKMYLKSSFAIRREKELHLQEHYYMIHPFSQMRFCWEGMMIITLFFALLIIPIHMSRKDYDNQVVVRLVFDMIYVIDIIITLNTGYQNTSTKKIVMNRKQVAISAHYSNYMSSWFALDLLTCLNMEVIVYFIYRSSKQVSFTIRMPTVFKLGRIITLLKYMNRYRDYRQFSLYKFKMFSMALIYFIILVWATSALYLVKIEDGVTFLHCCYEITQLFFLISHGYTKQSANVRVLCFEIVCTLMGVILQLFFFAQLLQTMSRYNASTNKYHEMVQQLRDYMNTKDLPAKMVQRVMQYFDFRFQKNYFKEEEILGTLSQKLIQEINIHSCESLIANVHIFKNMPTSVVLKMTSVMKQEIFLPNDVIVQANTIGDCMYFISSGTVAVYTPSGKEVCHLTDGTNFGEVSLIMEHATRVATVVAVDYCDLLLLSRKDFRVAIEPYPDLLQRTMRIARQRMKDIMLSEHYRNRPDEYFDFSTPEGIADFIAKMYEI